MARKKKRRAHKKNPKRSHARSAPRKKKRRAHKANPGRRARRTVHRRSRRHHASNPGRRHRRAHKRNPGRRRRAHRRNPMNPYVQGALAVVLSLGVAAAESFLPAILIPKDLGLQQKVRMGAGLAGTVGGLLLVKNHPVLGLAIAAPSFAVLAANTINGLIAKVLQPSMTSASAHATTQGALVRQLGAVYHQNMAALVASQRAPMGAVFHQNMAALVPSQRGPLGAVFHQNMAGPDGHPGAPWNQRTPFG